MSINRDVIQALAPFGFPVEFMHYDGKADAYFVFNFENEEPVAFSDDEPEFEEYNLQLHFFSNKSFNHVQLKRDVKNRLRALGWDYPRAFTLYEEDTKKNHLIFTTSKIKEI